MRKIPTLFQRNPDDRAHVLADVNPVCQWVIDGEGFPTRKWDGTCTKLDPDCNWWARREVKAGKTPPAGFLPEELDAVTDKLVGWEPMAQSPFAKFHAEATSSGGPLIPGTYELLGPKINGNPEMFDAHLLMPHGWALLFDRNELEAAPRDYDGLRVWLLDRPYEGIVWHHPDGRRAKLKRKDFTA